MKHDHDDPDVLTAGCAACHARVKQDQEEALVAESPLRRVTWRFMYRLPGDDGEDVTRHLSAQSVVRCPPGWDIFRLENWHTSVVGNAVLMALPSSVDMAWTDFACMTMSVTGGDIGEVVVPDVAEAPEEPPPSLF